MIELTVLREVRRAKKYVPTQRVGTRKREVKNGQLLSGSTKRSKIFYSMLKNGPKYINAGQDYYEDAYKGRVLSNLRQKAKQMGFDLINKDSEIITSTNFILTKHVVGSTFEVEGSFLLKIRKKSQNYSTIPPGQVPSAISAQKRPKAIPKPINTQDKYGP